MTEKTPLRKIADIKRAERELQNEIETEIKSIFKELECNGLDRVAFWDYEVWIHLKESCLIPTDLFSSLNRYFRASGHLSYSDGDEFIITYKW